MEQERIPFSVLDKMERGEIPMTEEGRREIEKWKALLDPAIRGQQLLMIPAASTAADIPKITAYLRPTGIPYAAGGFIEEVRKKLVFDLTGIVTTSKVLSPFPLIHQFQSQMQSFHKRIKYVSAKLNEIKVTSKNVYKNEKKFYKKEYGMKIPYEQFWDLYIKKHGDRSIPDVLANTSYETIAQDYAEFIRERMQKRKAVVKIIPFCKSHQNLTNQSFLTKNQQSEMHNVPFEVRDNYDKAHQDEAYLKRLDEYDLNRVYEYAQNRWLTHLRMAEGMFLANPNYLYPEKYRGGHEFDYWLDVEWQSQRCKAVIKEIERLRKVEKEPAIKSQTALTKPPIPKTLFDIWEEKTDTHGNKAYYNEVVQALIQNNYLQRVGNALQWRKQMRGHVSYCAGFVHTCISKGWIKDNYTAPDIVKILNNSFNAGIKSSTTFKTEALYSLISKYLDPFKSMDQNLK